MKKVVNYKWTDECMSVIDFLTLIKCVVVYDVSWWNEYQSCIDLCYPFYGWDNIVGEEYRRRLRLSQEYMKYRSWWKREGLKPRSSSCNNISYAKSR